MDISKYLDLFISETREHIKLLNENFLVLEKEPASSNAINQIFRSFHTIKGMAATMGYESLANLSHRLEDLLNEVKKGRIKIDQDIMNYFLTVVDFFESALALLKSGQEIPGVQNLMAKADAIMRGEKIAIEETRVRPIADLEEIRIKMGRLDHLVNLLSEFILARSRLARNQLRLKDPELTEAFETLARLIDELGDEIMKIRMLPLSSIFNFFPRWLRDEAQKLGKEVRLVIEGGDIEIDRSIIDGLKDPILHLLRNALDHGIEPNTKEGVIRLAALREKDFIRIFVEDNGQGMDPKRIKQVALKSGIIKNVEMEKMTDDEAIKLIFHPHFSTKEEVTGLSGRGVGLDVVKKSVENMRGDIEIKTILGQGTTFALILPIHMATIKVMIFALGKEIYSLPLVNIIETFNLSETDIRSVHHHEMVVFRNETLPVVRLKKLLGIPTNGLNRHAGILAWIANEKRVLLVDNILGQEEVIAKSLDPVLRHKTFSGVSIFSDGNPILILEPKGLE